MLRRIASSAVVFSALAVALALAASLLAAKPGSGTSPAVRPPYSPPPAGTPPWPKYGCNLPNNSQSLFLGPIMSPAVQWTFSSSTLTGPPVVDAEGKIYCNGSSRVQCLDATAIYSGKQ